MSVAELRLLRVWCGGAPRGPCSFALVLHCAALLSDLLRARAPADARSPSDPRPEGERSAPAPRSGRPP